jgi:hypothetical protein
LTRLSANVRVARLDDYDAIAKLELQYLGENKTWAEWKHLWADNPVYKEHPDWPIGWVIENEHKQIVGYIGNVPLSYEFEGRRLLAATGRAMVVDTQYRGYSLVLLDRFFKQKYVNLFVETTVNVEATKAHQLFHALPVPAGEWNQSIFWITNHQGFMESFLARRGWRLAKVLSYPLSVGLQLKNTLSDRAIRARRNGVEIVACTTFDERFDRFWQQLRRERVHILLATRSREVLDWHFGRALADNRAWALTVGNPSGMIAYAIFYRQDNTANGLKRMKLADFQSLEGNIELLTPILFRALEECAKQGIHVLEMSGLSAEKQRITDQLRPYKRKLSSWRYFYKTTNKQLAESLQNPQVWDPCCFDGDASL